MARPRLIAPRHGRQYIEIGPPKLNSIVRSSCVTIYGNKRMFVSRDKTILHYGYRVTFVPIGYAVLSDNGKDRVSPFNFDKN